ncbi:hypothetical protein LTR12_016196 [Friedmanniomyces endolithicus]|nr:hypothetical protein LTR74_018621 [Friedmanniomyces endolithicus]KAK1809434.1 hypothetical protein LTR12_016196 [Friedmanniomyces endolithicus]
MSEHSRASRPSKPNILRSLQHPIRNKSSCNTDLLDDARRLVRHIRRYAAGFENIPEELRASLENSYTDDLDLGQNVVYKSDSHRTTLGGDVTSRDVSCICLQAQGCQQRSEIEAAWNSYIHCPILSLVRRLSCHGSSIGSTNVTTARLNPKYKPAADLNQGPLPATPNEVSAAWPWESDHGRDFDHTLHEPTANRPIAMSMETKREGEGQITGPAQLEIWVTAHYNRLQEMTDGGSRWIALSDFVAHARAGMVPSPRPPRTRRGDVGNYCLQEDHAG